MNTKSKTLISEGSQKMSTFRYSDQLSAYSTHLRRCQGAGRQRTPRADPRLIDGFEDRSVLTICYCLLLKTRQMSCSKIWQIGLAYKYMSFDGFSLFLLNL